VLLQTSSFIGEKRKIDSFGNNIHFWERKAGRYSINRTSISIASAPTEEPEESTKKKSGHDACEETRTALISLEGRVARKERKTKERARRKA